MSNRLFSTAILLVLSTSNSLNAQEMVSLTVSANGRPGQDNPVRWRTDVDYLGRQIVSEYPDKESSRLGILDVTKPPYSADPTGKNDSTFAIQQALKDARDARLITFLPSGTYRVSKTITCVEGVIIQDNWAFGDSESPRNPVTSGAGGFRFASDYYPCTLVGSRTGQRSTIILSRLSQGFGDASKPKPVLHFWARFASKKANWWALQKNAPPDSNQSDTPNQRAPFISYNQLIADIDLKLGSGNPGAVGIDHQAAQGSAIEDVSVDATGAFAGLAKAPGSGGGINGLRVLNGRYGLYLKSTDQFRGTQPVPVISNVTLLGQTERAILYDGRGPLTVVGGEIEGSGIEAIVTKGAPWDGGMNLVDTVFRPRKGVCPISSNRSVYLHDVYFEHAMDIACIQGQPKLTAPSAGWTHVREYGAGPTLQYPSWLGGDLKKDSMFLNGHRAPESKVHLTMQSAAPPLDLQSRHTRSPLPPWDSKLVANVRAPPYHAKGNGEADDAPAIQRAIDENQFVFLPKGEYKLSRPLVLKPKTRLFGVSNVLSALSPLKSPEFIDPERPVPLIDTVDDALASTVLAFVELRLPVSQPSVYALRWRAGRHSVVQNIRPVPTTWEPHAAPALSSMVRIEGSGGGRWYNLYQDGWWSTGPDFRFLMVNGTHEPLSFYMLNPEHSRSSAQVEMRGARNVSIYSLKAEGMYTVLWMRNSRNVRIFGYGGPAAPRPEWSIFRIDQSQDFLLANINPGHFAYELKPYWDALYVSSDPRSWHLITELTNPPCGDANRIDVPGLEQVLVYKRTNSISADQDGAPLHGSPLPLSDAIQPVEDNKATGGRGQQTCLQ